MRKYIRGKSLWFAIFASFLNLAAFGWMSPEVADAATGNKYSSFTLQFSGWNKQIPSLVHRDPIDGIETTYVPIWYLLNNFDLLGVKGSWDGRNWNMTVISEKVSLPSNSNGTPSPGNEPLKIYVDNQLVQTALPYVTIDPSSGRNTTFVPIWYVMKMLKYIQGASTWNGSSWNITRYASKLDLVYQLADAFQGGGASARNQHYDDLTPDETDDIGDVTTRNGVIAVQPDTPTHFGASDPVTLNVADQSAERYLTDFNETATGYFPGDSPVEYGNLTGINRGIGSEQYLTLDEVKLLAKNIEDMISNGWQLLKPGQYQVIYPWTSEYGLFNIPYKNYGKPLYSVPLNIHDAITEKYRLFNQVTFTYDSSLTKENNAEYVNEQYDLSIPTLPLTSSWILTVDWVPIYDKDTLQIRYIKDSPIRYSLDGGKTWLAPKDDFFNSSIIGDGGMTNPPSRILIKSLNPYQGVYSQPYIQMSERVDGKIYTIGKISFENGHAQTDNVALNPRIGVAGSVNLDLG